MRLLRQELPEIPLVAALETGFHQTIPAARFLYAVPLEWAKFGIRRWGFHGASHRYIAERTAHLLRNPRAKIISCHLGGSSSLCAISGRKVGGDEHGHESADRLAAEQPRRRFRSVRLAGHHAGDRQELEQVLDDLANRSGLFGLSGHNDLRDIEEDVVKNDGPGCSEQALDVFVTAVRHYLGAYLLLLNGADAIVFTGGIGENSARCPIRRVRVPRLVRHSPRSAPQ